VGENLQARRRVFAPRISAAGFTLIELMVTILVAAMLLAVAVPSFQSTINSNRLAGATNELLTSLQTARIEAMRFNRRATLCLSRNPTSDTPTCAPAGATDATGYITYIDVNSNDLYNTGTDMLVRQSTLPGNVRILPSSNLATANGSQVTYRADGFARSGPINDRLEANIDVCLPTNRPAENVRRIEIGLGSRATVTRVDTDADCNTAPGNP
jgi:type IV fimbrial biogenesis protein FimT